MTNGNIVCASPFHDTDEGEWEAFDTLPHFVRLMLWESVVDWSALTIQALIDHFSLRMAEPAIKNANRQEIADFAKLWPEQLGQYPHVAAQATIQSYRRRVLA